jgi:hypothetical protein
MATKKRLIDRVPNIAEGDLSEEIYTAAYHAESALLRAGAVAGKDYTYADLFGMSATLVAGMMNRGYIGQHEYPADHVLPDKKKAARLKS